MTSTLYAMDAEIAYRQERARNSIRHLTRKQRKHECYVVVHPAGDARA